MEQFVKFTDAGGTELYLTRKEVEQVNKRLEFSHTIKVFGMHTSRPLYIMPKEFECGVRRFKHYGGEKERLLDIGKHTKWESRIHALRNRSDLIMLLLLAGCVAALWFLGGGKTPAIAYAILDFSDQGIGRYFVPAAAALLLLTLLLFLYMRKHSATFEVRRE